MTTKTLGCLTPANITKLRKASKELDTLAFSATSAQDHALMLLRVQELLGAVLTDIIYRPNDNGGSGQAG